MTHSAPWANCADKTLNFQTLCVFKPAGQLKLSINVAVVSCLQGQRALKSYSRMIGITFLPKAIIDATIYSIRLLQRPTESSNSKLNRSKNRATFGFVESKSRHMWGAQSDLSLCKLAQNKEFARRLPHANASAGCDRCHIFNMTFVIASPTGTMLD